ncbi:MAG: methionyl-tRNA formyltransferase [Oligoflexia bacterium]|nr:methionyl-tRNA formyltransferase [Oligoflexia bacterium]
MKIIFYGTPHFAVPSLKALLDAPGFDVRAVITQPDRPAGRGHKLQASPIKQLAVDRGVAVMQPGRIKKELKSFRAGLEALGPIDAAVVVAFGQILPLEILNLPNSGSINAHASLLPRWRGAAPIQRAMLEGDQETGVCLMRMEQGLDSGPVFSRLAVEIEDSDYCDQLHDKLAAAAASLLVRDLPQIVAGQIAAQPQNEGLVTYAHKIENQDALIDWSRSNLEIWRQVRAFSPYPGAFTTLNGARLKILRARPIESMRTQQVTAGEIELTDRQQLEVRCGQGSLSIEELQLEGRRRQPVAEFLKGFRITVGSRMA